MRASNGYLEFQNTKVFRYGGVSFPEGTNYNIFVSGLMQMFWIYIHNSRKRKEPRRAHY